MQKSETKPKRGSHFSTLLWKNFLLKKNLTTLLEMLLPMAPLLAVFIILASQNDTPVPTHVDDSNPYNLTIPYFSTSKVSPLSSLLGMLAERQQLGNKTDKECYNKVFKLKYMNINDPNSEYAVPKSCPDNLKLSKLAIVPDNMYTRNYFMQAASKWYPRKEVNVTKDDTIVTPALEDMVHWFNTEEELETYVKSSTYGSSTYKPSIPAAIVFSKFPTTVPVKDTSGKDWEYSIRLGSDDTSGFFPKVPSTSNSVGNGNGFFEYRFGGFMTLQTLVARFLNCNPEFDIATNSTGACTGTNGAEYEPQFFELFSKEPEEPDVSGTAAGSLLAICCAILSAFFFFGVLKSFVLEKETKMREMMMIMGVSSQTFFSSWFATYCIIGTITAMLETLFAKLGFFEDSDVLLLFILFLLFNFSLVAFGFLVSVFFDQTKTAFYAGAILFGAGFFLGEHPIKGAAVTLSHFLPVSGFLWAFKAGSVHNVTFDSCTIVYEVASVAQGLQGMIVGMVLHVVLGLYFDQIVPKDYGTTKPWYFVFTPLLRLMNTPATEEKAEALLSKDSCCSIEMHAVNDNIEVVSRELQQQAGSNQALVIRELRKVFGKFAAVDGLNLNLYQNQITALLGHNGAGKSTLINMLTGMYMPTSGDANVFGKSLVNDIDSIRRIIGYCPQHNTLYDSLTVKQHIMFFGRIKNIPLNEMGATVEKCLEEVGLSEKVDSRVKALSGGMKRKLSVAIAYLGDSKLVFLDEPTSGMDPCSRRSTWDVLEKKRAGRVTILTTHFMDEADLLGDRIAIMSEGQLKCVGSSMFLKQRFGAGYVLTSVLDQTSSNDKVLESIKKYVPDALVSSHVGTEFSVQLPFGASSKFPSLLRHLDSQKNTLGLKEYGISVTTMEQVFLKVAQVDFEEDASDCTSSTDEERMDSTVFLHFVALLIKRFHEAKRNKRFFFWCFLLPALFLIILTALVERLNFKDNISSVRKNGSDPKLALNKVNHVVPYLNVNGSAFSEGLVRETGVAAKEIPFKAFDGDYFTSLGRNYSGNDTAPAYAAEACFAWGYGVKTEHFERPDKSTTQYGAYVLQGQSSSDFRYAIGVNTSFTHSAPTLKALLDDAYFQRTRTDGLKNRVVVYQHPLPPLPSPLNTNISINVKIQDTSKGLFCLLVIVFSYALYSAGVIYQAVAEKVSEAKQQQYLSGVSCSMYWVTNFVWDYMVYLILCCVAIVSIHGFSIEAFMKICFENDETESPVCLDNVFAAVAVSMITFGSAMIGFCYVISFAFRSPATSQNIALLFNAVLYFVIYVASGALDSLVSTLEMNRSLKYLWYITIPMYNLYDGMIRLLNYHDGGYSYPIIEWDDYDKKYEVSQSKPEILQSAFDSKLLGEKILIFSIQAIGFLVLAILMDTYGEKILHYLKGTKVPSESCDKNIVDEDVSEEKTRVATTPYTEDLIRIEGLKKVYQNGAKPAVNDLSFGLQQGSCFGFLGVNGAGKTSTLKMITGETLPTSGNAFIQGHDIVSSQSAVRKRIGYCPQFDALIDLLTVREHLELYGRLKGYTSDSLEHVVQEKLRTLELGKFEKTLSKNLSGGNKRKLSVAIAVIGAPPVIFLDEPSTGMDPVARRFMWKVISKQCETSTVVLTTHSMEECEALCDKAGIMVAGEFKCFGSIQHLKSRFGSGLSVEVKLKAPSNDEITAWIQNNLTEVEKGAFDKGAKSEVERILIRMHRQHLLETATQDKVLDVSVFAQLNIEEEKADKLKEFMLATFSHSTLSEKNGLHAVYTVSTEKSLADVFEAVENLQMDVEDYRVCKVTLEQIFNKFAAIQEGN